MRRISRAFIDAALAAVVLAGLGPSGAAAQWTPVRDVERNMIPYGGYLPFRGYPQYSGAPLGGYTPFGVNNCEGGWLYLDYGIGYDDFARSNAFGSDAQYGPGNNNNAGSGFRPFERGRGPWNNYGRAGIIPPPSP